MLNEGRQSTPLIWIPHLQDDCNCQHGLARDEYTIRGVAYAIMLPVCQAWFRSSTERRYLLNEYVEEHAGWKLIRGTQIHDHRWHAPGLPHRSIEHDLTPVVRQGLYAAQCWFLRRDVLRYVRLAWGFAKCEVCGAREGTWERHSMPFESRVMLSCGRPDCEEAMDKDWRKSWELWQQKQSAEAEELQSLRNCRLQVKALRKFLKTGDPEALTSLEPEFRPVSSSPD